MIQDGIGKNLPAFYDSDLSINLDAAANTPATPDVIAAIVAALEGGAGNAASAHEFGARSRKILAAARDSVLRLVDGAFEEGVVFTSGCTEANNMVLRSGFAGTLVTTSVEHPSILRAAAQAPSPERVHVLGVDAEGIVDLATLTALAASIQGPLLVSIQAANSETGILQPIDKIAAILAGRSQTLFHSDAAQAFGKVPIDLAEGRGPDVITVSAHKLHGPMGVGAVVAGTRDVPLAPLLFGGDQEHGLRAGTEAVPLIAGFGVACDERASTLAGSVAHMAALRERFEGRLRTAVPDAILLGASAPRLPNIMSIRFPGIDAMALAGQLDVRGVAASQGSACSSQRPEPSHVLTALGLTEAEAFETLRFSVSALNSAAEIDIAADVVAASVSLLRNRSWQLA
ncbi:Aminotransferase class V [uncultured Sphingopyxis sp.]|uniref:Cysteine desulfurase n=1 Tax=uncultured Sphingopyxis sp. TaxID=310581 RepID=A0A1Y5PRK9_9SPHN|nr:Aminotransferase class V [uncultured Sphingopyxis sp.]